MNVAVLAFTDIEQTIPFRHESEVTAEQQHRGTTAAEDDDDGRRPWRRRPRGGAPASVSSCVA